jgi:hypothetical protein
MLKAMSDTPATEPTKTSLENSVNYFLADKITDASTPIATKKWLTSDNTLVYLTICNVAETTVPRIKVQVLQRVPGGVHETAYQLFSDHRLVKLNNDMIFGNQAGAAGDKSEDVSESEAQALIAQVNALASARHML